jgi:predicted SAM-dependent methyltransferase/glycosyltransferase involved in cell wall biosynthesis
MKLDIFTIVWGEMIDTYLQVTLPSILQQGNIPAVRESIRYVFYTNSEGESKIKESALYKKLEESVPVTWYPLQGEEWELKKNILAQMKDSASTGSYMLPVPPDIALGNESLSNLVKTIDDSGCNPLLYAIPRIIEDGFETVKSSFDAGKNVSNREMVSITMEHLWKRTYPITDEGSYWNVSFPLPAPCFLPDEYLIDLLAADTSTSGFTFDHILPFAMVEKEYPWKIVDHSDMFFGVERHKQVLVQKSSIVGGWRQEKQSDGDKSRKAEEFFNQYSQVWCGADEARKPKGFVSMVICCVDSLEPTRRCIESIFENTPLPYEVIVVAQACGPETLAWLSKLKLDGKIELLLSPIPLGAATALNHGIRASIGDYIFTMSNSCIIKKGWLYPLLDTLRNHPEYGWVSAQHVRPGVVMSFSAGALYSKKAFLDAGLYDEDYSGGIGFDDDDLLRRFWKAGYKPHAVKESVIYRQPEVQGGSTYKMLFGDNMKPLFKKNRNIFYSKWGETRTDWERVAGVSPTIDPSDVIEGIHRIDWVRSKVNINDTILEVACAENPVWKGTPFKVTTMDRSTRPEEQCFPDVTGEAERLPFDDKFFDVVCLGELLEHVPDPQLVLKEAVRVARKKVIITCPDEYSWPDELKPFWNPGHVRFYTYSILKEDLEAPGLPFKIWNVKFNNWSHWCAEIYCNGEGGDIMTGSEIRRETLTGTKVIREETVKERVIKLNIGSFTVMLPAPEWVNLDILDLSQYAKENNFMFRQVDVNQGIPYVNSCVDLINASHLIEHLTVDQGLNFLKECWRVLKPGSKIRVGTPNVQLLIDAYVSDNMDSFNNIQPDEYKQAPSQADKFWRILTAGHKTCYDKDALFDILRRAGFEYVEESGYNPELDKFPEVSLYVEAIKPPDAVEKPEPQVVPQKEEIPEYWRRFANRKAE